MAEGIRRSAPLVTAAAGVLAFTFAVYATSGVVGWSWASGSRPPRRVPAGSARPAGCRPGRGVG
ncbi:hypothetical protein V1J52_03555 [Streptomyces sp. TRM 70351]|uniref:hypothetical protein n=1 Tax=Streptomyces sp. TRM 70351 TaxID=3116552 RepID=UPI002E7BC37E|nr:hypothetical protein [Streptomyces sp. TRM 70351]MEE1927264.1 hypothetical protein [Streptomyces sp. TRM 70351]